jgi:hypothetical protein
MLALLAAFAFVCCCACPGYLAKPIWEQYPADVVIPETVADLTLYKNSANDQLVEQLQRELRAEHQFVDETFAAVYRDRLGKRVVIFGTIGLRLTPESDLEDEMSRLRSRYALATPQSLDTDVRGYYQQCAVGVANGTNVVVCGWADHGSLGIALFNRRSLPESAALLAEFRDAMIIRK